MGDVGDERDTAYTCSYSPDSDSFLTSVLPIPPEAPITNALPLNINFLTFSFAGYTAFFSG